MATFKSTEKVYPAMYEQGKLWYHATRNDVKSILVRYNLVIYPNYDLIKFVTDDQKIYFNKRNTWAWFKCFLSAKACELIIKELLSDYVEHYAIITHDRCKNEDGSPKPVHTHVLIKFFRNESYTTKIVEYFHADNVSDPQHKVRNTFNYLTHDTDACRKKGKQRYSVDERLCDDVAFFENFVSEDKDVTMSIIDDIISGKTFRELGNTYGRDYVIHKRQYHDFAHCVAVEEGVNDPFKGYKVSMQDGLVVLYDEETGYVHRFAKDLNTLHKLMNREQESAEALKEFKQCELKNLHLKT